MAEAKQQRASKAQRLWLICGCIIATQSLIAGCQIDSRFHEVPKSVCVSEEVWTYSDKDSPLMNPGRSCVQCHAETNDVDHAPFYAFGGTVMLGEHEADDCRGAPDVTVVLTDANGKEWTIPTNSAGNFWLVPDEDDVAMPYTARIVDKAGNERVKQIPVDEGDCAFCHTQDGVNGAAGRLIPPEIP